MIPRPGYDQVASILESSSKGAWPRSAGRALGRIG
jgi:hypothetical protein